jgi:hypothetical protein
MHDSDGKWKRGYIERLLVPVGFLVAKSGRKTYIYNRSDVIAAEKTREFKLLKYKEHKAGVEYYRSELIADGITPPEKTTNPKRKIGRPGRTIEERVINIIERKQPKYREIQQNVRREFPDVEKLKTVLAALESSGRIIKDKDGNYRILEFVF